MLTLTLVAPGGISSVLTGMFNYPQVPPHHFLRVRYSGTGHFLLSHFEVSVYVASDSGITATYGHRTHQTNATSS